FRGSGVALTVDDRSHHDGTRAVLEELATRMRPRRCSSSETGSNYCQRWLRISPAAGHEIALDGYRHRLLLRRTPKARAEDLDRAAAAIDTGVTPRCNLRTASSVSRGCRCPFVRVGADALVALKPRLERGRGGRDDRTRAT